MSLAGRQGGGGSGIWVEFLPLCLDPLQPDARHAISPCLSFQSVKWECVWPLWYWWGSKYFFTSIYGQAYHVLPIPPLCIAPSFRPGQCGRTSSKTALLQPALALRPCRALIAAGSCAQQHEHGGWMPGANQEKNCPLLIPLLSPPRESGRVKSSNQYEAHAAIVILTTTRVILVAVVNTAATSLVFPILL